MSLLKTINSLLLLITLFFGSALFAQEQEKHEHKHHKNEISMANSPVYFTNENVVAYGIHFHYVRKIPKTDLALGLGYEKIFDQHGHNTLGVVCSYRPINKLAFNTSPGVTFEDIGGPPQFTLHLETAYEFEWEDFHIGPVFEFAYDKEDNHLSLGLHFGYGF